MENSSIINFKPKSFSKRLSRNVTPIVHQHAVFGNIDESISSTTNGNTNIISGFDDTSDSDKFHEEEENVTCIYCHENNLNYLIRCDICKNHFCNSGIKSHFYEHSNFCQHDKFSLLNYEYNKKNLNPQEDDKDNPKIIENNKRKKFQRSRIQCAICSNNIVYQLIYIMINRSDKELIDLQNVDEIYKISKLLNVEKKIVFVCDPHYNNQCFNKCQSSIFEGLELDEDYYRSVVNEDQCIDPLLIKTKLQLGNNDKRIKECNFSDILMIEKQRLHLLKLKYLKKNDIYNIMTDYEIENNHDLKFEELTLQEDEESSDSDDNQNDNHKSSQKDDKYSLKSPLLDEEKQLFIDKTKSLKEMHENSKNFIFSNFEDFVIFNGKLLYIEQYDMLAMTASPSIQLANNMIFVPYKKITFHSTSIKDEIPKSNNNNADNLFEESEYYKSITNSIFTDSTYDVVIRLNTNYNLPKLKIGQVLGLESSPFEEEERKKNNQYTSKDILGFAVVKQVPGNTFNPELKLKMLPISKTNFIGDENKLKHFCERYFSNGDLDGKSKKQALDKLLDSFEVTSYSKFRILPFDFLFSRIFTTMFKIMMGETKMDNYLMNLIMGKKFENFEFNLNQRKNNSNIGYDYIPGINLNLQQNRALDNIDTNKVTLVKGGFGTGKTVVALEMIEKLISKKMTPILVCSSNNLVVDDLCGRLENINQKKKRDYLISRIVAPLKEDQYNINHRIADLCFHNFLLFNAPEELISLNIKKKMNQLSLINKARLAKFYKEYFQQQDVIFSTSYTAGDDRLNGVKFKSIIIENCQLEMNLISLLPLSRNCDRLILFGDEKQGSPFIYSNGEDDLNISFLKQSLLQRIMYNRLLNPIVFTEQYRIMNNSSNGKKSVSKTSSPMILQGGNIIGNNPGGNLDEYANKVYYNNELVRGVSTRKFNTVRKKNTNETNSMNRSSSFSSMNKLRNMNDCKTGNGILKRSPSMRSPNNGMSSPLGRSPSLRSFKSPSSFRSSMIISNSGSIEGFGSSMNTNGVDDIFPNEKLNVVFYDMKDDRRHKTIEIKYHKKMNNIENFFINKKTYYNLEECHRIAEVIKKLREGTYDNGDNRNEGVEFEDIGIITLFAGQRVALAQILNRELGSNTNSKKKPVSFNKLNNSKNDFLFENHDLNETEVYKNEYILKQKLQIGTAKSFSNVEKKYIIVSTVVSSENAVTMNNSIAELRDELGAMHDMNELLVSMLTRCEKGLIIVGDSAALRHVDQKEGGNVPVFGSYLRYLEDYGCIVKNI